MVGWGTPRYPSSITLNLATRASPEDVAPTIHDISRAPPIPPNDLLYEPTRDPSQGWLNACSGVGGGRREDAFIHLGVGPEVGSKEGSTGGIGGAWKCSEG